jgi:DnaJ-class molecular chaperone
MRTIRINDVEYQDKNICPRCHGKGKIPNFKHNQKGICFRCWGTGRYFNERSELIDRGLKVTRINFNLAEARKRIRETQEEIL